MSFFIVHDNKFFLFLLIMFLVQASVDTKDSNPCINVPDRRDTGFSSRP